MPVIGLAKLSEDDIASAATCDIGSTDTIRVNITGTTTITSFGTAANRLRFISFAGALTLTHNATSLKLPGSANIATAAGDTAIASSDASGNWTVRSYTRAAVGPSLKGTFTPTVTFGGGSTGLALSTAAATFTRIFDRVFFSISIALSVKGSSTGNLVIGGLPYTAAAELTPILPYLSSMTSGVGDTMLLARVSASSTNIQLFKMSAGNAVSLTDADCTNTSAIFVAGQYRAAA